MNSYWEKYIQSPAFDAAALQKAVQREKAERNLGAFIQQAWDVIEPGTTYIDNWHIELIAEHLQAVNDGELRRLIINIPPRHMKSIEATVCYPVWTWTKAPEKRFIKVSYSDSLSRKHNILSRDIIRDPLIFPKGTFKDTTDTLVQRILYMVDKPTTSDPPKKPHSRKTVTGAGNKANSKQAQCKYCAGNNLKLCQHQ